MKRAADMITPEYQGHPFDGPQYANVLCCVCGCSIQPNPSMMCVQCLRSSVDITDGISKQVVLPHCKECNRYMKPPWVRCELESRELLALCLKKIKGLNKVKLIDAAFIWTEPHSKRIKVKCTVQKEVVNGAIMQQSFTVEFFVQSHQCDDCKKSYTPHSWNALVQVRQRADHKRSFMFLEQIILKNDAHEKVLNIVEKPDGIDFQFNHRSHAQRFSDFVAQYFPTKSKMSKQLISHDANSNTFYYKYTIYQEMCPVCKDDIVYLPQKLANSYGGVPQLMLVYKLTTSIHLIDPFSLRCLDIPTVNYWKNPFNAVLKRKHLSEFIVLDIEQVSENQTAKATNAHRKNLVSAVDKFKLVDVEVARASDLGTNDERVTVRTLLGNTLKVGDTVLGYDLRTLNLSGIDSDLGMEKILGDVVLVRKTFKNRDKRAAKRPWMLSQLPKNVDESDCRMKDDGDQAAKDLEDFKREIEEDPEMRKEINLYRDPKYTPVEKGGDEEDEWEDEDEDLQGVQLSDLLDGLTLEDVPENEKMGYA